MTPVHVRARRGVQSSLSAICRSGTHAAPDLLDVRLVLLQPLLDGGGEPVDSGLVLPLDRRHEADLAVGRNVIFPQAALSHYMHSFACVSRIS